jgi:hypothetical protein
MQVELVYQNQSLLKSHLTDIVRSNRKIREEAEMRYLTVTIEPGPEYGGWDFL